MEKLLITLMLVAALVKFGISVSDFRNCHSQQCIQMVEKRSRDVLRVDWRPISVFPEEARRFK
jgi:hypothetical protein